MAEHLPSHLPATTAAPAHPAAQPDKVPPAFPNRSRVLFPCNLRWRMSSGAAALWAPLVRAGNMTRNRRVDLLTHRNMPKMHKLVLQENERPHPAAQPPVQPGNAAPPAAKKTRPPAPRRCPHPQWAGCRGESMLGTCCMAAQKARQSLQSWLACNTSGMIHALCRYITVQELDSVPSYMRSRLTLEKVSFSMQCALTGHVY